jgi:hypothetical protein
VGEVPLYLQHVRGCHARGLSFLIKTSAPHDSWSSLYTSDPLHRHPQSPFPNYHTSIVIGYMEAYRHLAVPGVLCLIFFLSFSSQYLFHHIDPEPLSKKDATIFNALIAALLICYARSVLTDPGHIPSDWAEESKLSAVAGAKPRWCRKCEAVKPPRAHHCKICKRLVVISLEEIKADLLP